MKTIFKKGMALMLAAIIGAGIPLLPAKEVNAATTAKYSMTTTYSGGIQTGYPFTGVSGDVKGSVGTCVDPWVSPFNGTTTGTIYKISNTTRTARVAYYIYKKGWSPATSGTYMGVKLGMAIHRALCTARVNDKLYTSRTKTELWNRFYSIETSTTKFNTKGIQKKLGVAEDGVLGPETIKAIQKEIGATVDGSWGTETSSKMQEYLGVKVDGFAVEESLTALNEWSYK